MSGRKKKLSDKLKKYNTVLIISLVVLMVLLGVLMIYKMFGNNDYYKKVSRKDNIEKSKKQDSDAYETIGWVRVQGTNIDYPLFGVIKDTYDYPVTDSYLWSLNMDRKFHNTMLVYGHNIMNLGPNPKKHDENFTRMEELMNFVYFDFAKENQFIQLTINGEDYLYKVFAVNFMAVGDLNEYPTGDWKEEISEEYVKRLRDESLFDYDVEVTKEDSILSVVTCTRFFDDKASSDFLITGRMVKPGEKVEKTSVRRNRNYEKIDQIMKGAEDDESIEDA